MLSDIASESVRGGPWRFSAIACLMVLACAGCERPQTPTEQRAAPTVLVEEVQERDVTVYSYFTGFTEANEAVVVEARVRGILQSMHFEPTAHVNEGDLLFKIEPDQYLAAVDSAKAQKELDLARLALATANRIRVQALVQTNTVTEQEYQTRVAEEAEAAAQIKVDDAEIRMKEIDLGYTNVTAPISGLANRNLVDIGNLVGPGADVSSELVSIRNLDPMYVYFDVSDRYVQLMLERGIVRDLEKSGPTNEYPVECGTKEDNGYPHKGVIDYMDNTLERSQGVAVVRGTFKNEDYRMFPGMVMQVRVPSPERKDAILVRDSAIGSDIQGRFVLVVDKDNVVHRRAIELGPLLEDGYRVALPAKAATDDAVDQMVEGEGEKEQFLKAGERYIVEGIQKARLGMTVNPKPAKPPRGEKPSPEAPTPRPPHQPSAPSPPRQPAALPSPNANLSGELR